MVRASYAMFASQLPGDAGEVRVADSVLPCATTTRWTGTATASRRSSEILFNQGLQDYLGLRPDQPEPRCRRVNTRRPERQGADHARVPGRHGQGDCCRASRVSGTFTYRRMVDLIWDPLTGVKSSDYTQTGTLTGNAPGARRMQRAALRAAVGGGAGRRRRDRDQPPGLSPALSRLSSSARTKRMSNHWMARLRLLDQRLARILRRSVAVDRRSDARRRRRRSRQARQFAGPQIDGGLVVRKAAAAARATSTWSRRSYQIVANGSYQGPWGSNFGANLVTRARATREPFFQSNVATGDPLGRKTVLLVNQVDALPAAGGDLARRPRREAVHVRPSTHLALDFDVFNVLNAGTVLGQAVRRAADRRDRLRPDAGDHEPSHRQAGRAVCILNSEFSTLNS